MANELVAKVRAAAAASEVVRAVAAIRKDGGQDWVFHDQPLRSLYRDEITQLENLGNTAEDWSRVRVADGFNWRNVRQCSFHGDVLLGRFTGQVRAAEGVELPTGVYQSTLSNCMVGSNALIRDVKLLANYVIAEGAVLLNVGSLTCDARTTFGNGIKISVGIESGGRDIAIFAELDAATAAAVARAAGNLEVRRLYNEVVADYTAQVACYRGVVARNALVRNTPAIRNSFVGSSARVDGATLVADCTLLSNAEEPSRVESGACLSNALLQWGCQVRTMAQVDRSVLTEHSHVESHGTVTSSILGPNTGVAKGEVTACLLGPFVTLHHQSLLIATCWPEGRGNVSYGANVGSNHTSKAPDQEFWAGEGTFLGLGVNVKFPTDLSRAPYTILACGVTTQPQKVTFPFSLINLPSGAHPDVPPTFNEIIPAWLLTENLYTLIRSEGKYRSRNQARRQAFDFRVFRRETVDAMRDAVRRLEAVRRVKEVYTERDIEGLGKNFFLDCYRKRAIEAYQFFIRYYALLSLKTKVEQLAKDAAMERIGSVLTTPSGDSDWEHARLLLVEDLGLRQVAAALRQLPAMLSRIASDVERSKVRDDERGVRIIDDYAQVHGKASKDAFVRKTWELAAEGEREIESLLDQLKSRSPIHETSRPPMATV